MQTINAPIIDLNDSTLPIVASTVKEMTEQINALVSDEKYIASKEYVAEVDSKVAAIKSERTKFLANLQESGRKWFTKWLDKSKSKKKSATIEGLEFALRAEKASFNINDDKKALAYFKEKYPDAVVVKEEVMISKLKDEQLQELLDLKASVQTKNGFTYSKPKQDSFTIKVK